MLEGAFVETLMMHPNTRPYPQMPQETSGVYLSSKTYIRYALRESDYPTLIIVDPIYDGDRDVIKPGYYELALSDEHDFLILIQSKEAVAVIPVFKVEEDAKEPQKGWGTAPTIQKSSWRYDSGFIAILPENEV